MRQAFPPLPWIRAFESAARHRNFTQAAEELGLTPAAVSYHIRALEEDLGYPLFDRTKRPMALTTMGELYMPWVARAFAVLGQGTADVFGPRAGRQVRLRCLQSFAVLWLIPRLPAFRAAYPDVRLQFHMSSWSSTIENDKLDLDIRFGDGDWRGERSELLLRRPIIPVCCPDLVRPDLDLAALAQAPLIEVIGVADTWRQFFLQEGLSPPARSAALQVDQSVAALDMATLGMGHMLAFQLYADPYLADGRLVQSLPLEKHTDQALHLITTDEVLGHDAALFRDWLIDTLRD